MKEKGTSQRRAFVLIELLSFVILASMLLTVIWKLMVDSVYVQRMAAQYAHRTGAMDAMLRTLRSDTIQAGAYCWDGATLTLTEIADEPGTVVFKFVSGRARRLSGGAETCVWQAPRLRFEARVLQGEVGDVLEVIFIEDPPPRPSRVALRTHAASVCLPSRRIAERP